MRSTVVPLSFIILIAFVCELPAATSATAFFIGNSLTAGTTGSDAVKNLAAARGINLTYGWHIRYGSSLKFIYDNPHLANGVSGYGYWNTALANNTWDAVTLQTWGDKLADNKTAIAGLINTTRANPTNQNARFYIFDNWCQEHQPTDYSVQWMRTYDRTEPNSTQRRIDTWTRDYSDELMEQLHGAAFNSPVDIKRIPTGEVFYQLDQLAQNGQLPGLTGIEQVYIDPWHVGDTGNYVGTVTFFATLYAQDPSGLPAPSGMDPALAAKIQQTVWNVVLGDPYTDVTAPCAWNNASNVNNDWNRGGNWYGGVASGATSDISFNLGSTYTVNVTPNANARGMQVNSGNVTAALNGNTLSLGSNLTIKSNAALAIGGSGALNVAGDVRLTDSGLLRLSPGGNKTLKLASLSSSDVSKLDLSDNQLVVTSMPVGSRNGTTYTGVTGLLQSGRNGGYWNGSGIVTTMPNATSGLRLMSLGVATAQETGRTGLHFAGSVLSATDVLVMYTLAGDANLSGHIDVDDYSQIDFNYSTRGALSGWFNGDFDYSGALDIDDYVIIDFYWANQDAAQLTGTATVVSSVPEPSSLAIASVAALTMLRRSARRR